MTRSSRHQCGRWMLSLLAAAVLTGLPARADSADSTKPVVQGITLPYGNKPTQLGFEGPGFVKTVDVKEGDHVKAGQKLMTQDATKEELELKALKLDTSDVIVKAAMAQRDAAVATFKVVENAYKVNGAGNEADYDKAKADKEESELEIVKEQQEQQIKIVKYEKQKQVVDDMTLKSPVDGYIQTIQVHVGENVDPAKPVLTIVQNDPLIVEMNLQTATAQKLKLGQMFNVSYDQQTWTPAKLTYKAPMALADGGVQTVHLQLSNPEGRDSGQVIFMQLLPDSTATPAAADAGNTPPTVTAGAK